MADKTQWLKNQLSAHKTEMECLFDQYDIDAPVSISGVQIGIQRFGSAFAKSVIGIVRSEIKYNDGDETGEIDTSSWSSAEWMNFIANLSDLGLGVWGKIQAGKNGNFTDNNAEDQYAAQTSGSNLPTMLIYAGGGILFLLVVLIVIQILKK